MILYQTLNQLLIFLKIACAGIFSNFIIIFFDLINIKNKKFKFVNYFFQFFTYSIVFLIYFFLNLKLNYGQLRLYFFASYFFLFSFFRFLFKKILAKLKSRCYNNHKRKNDGQFEKVVEKSDNV